jgi:hypothetical protein
VTLGLVGLEFAGLLCFGFVGILLLGHEQGLYEVSYWSGWIDQFRLEVVSNMFEGASEYGLTSIWAVASHSSSFEIVLVETPCTQLAI